MDIQKILSYKGENSENNQIDLYEKFYKDIMKEFDFKNLNLQPTYEKFLKTVPLNPPLINISHYLSLSFQKYLESFEYRIILLGYEHSGKTTLYKQFNYYKNNNIIFKKDLLIKNTIQVNILIYLSKIIQVCIERNLFKLYHSNEYAQKILLIIKENYLELLIESNQFYTEEIHKLIVEILKDPAVKNVMNGEIIMINFPDGLNQL